MDQAKIDEILKHLGPRVAGPPGLLMMTIRKLYEEVSKDTSLTTKEARLAKVSELISGHQSAESAKLPATMPAAIKQRHEESAKKMLEQMIQNVSKSLQ